MGIMSFIACGRGGGGPRSTTGRIASCDHVGCTEAVNIASRDDYVTAAAEGWRRNDEDVRCPRHAFELDGVR